MGWRGRFGSKESVNRVTMEITGRVIQVMEVKTGTSGKGSWSKQDFVLETGDKYPKKVCITLWGQENIDKYDLVEGMRVTAFLEIESREYNGNWYTNVKAWKIQWDEQKRPDFPSADKQPVREKTWQNPGPVVDTTRDGGIDDLPF